jgi:hypothetical protein
MSCARGGTYPVFLKYQPVGTFPALAQKVGSTLGISPFKDLRPDTLYVGLNMPFAGRFSYFKSEPSLEKTIQESLLRFLPPYGVKPVVLSAWDGKPESLKTLETDSALTVEIKKFWLEGKSSVFHTNVRTSIGFLIHLGVKQDGKVYTRNVEVEREMITYGLSPDKAQDTLNQVLTEVFDSYFSNPY